MFTFNPEITLGSIATLLAVLSAWLIPIFAHHRNVKQEENATKVGVRLYLDVLRIKIQNRITHLSERKVGTNNLLVGFEMENEQNFKALEKYLLVPNMNAKARTELFALVTYFKLSKEISSISDFEELYSRISKESLEKHFPPQVSTKIKRNQINI